MKTTTLLQLFELTLCAQAAQPRAPEPIPVPLRDLKFGAINFLHTTDTHGWHAGHLLEASYSADWGDYIDFTARLREKIEADGNDLLVVDSGDRVEGNGLYDGDVPKGNHTFKVFTKQHMDIICVGNHELYQKNTSENEYNIVVPAYRSSYIASNLDIVDPKTGQVVAMAPRFKKFTTKNRGIRILAFGFIFNFDRNWNNTIVHPVEKTVQEPWFQRVLGDRAIDLIVVAAHAPARSPELTAIYNAIRRVKPDIPIQFLGGHYHIRDYKKYDDKAYALASGRFMETVGFQSIDGIEGEGGHYHTTSPNTTSPTWFRSYIDNNLYSYYHHSQTNTSTFHSSYGLSVSAEINSARKTLGLDHVYGCAPHDLWMSRAPFPANDSIYTWLNETVFPQIVIEPDRKDKSRIVLANTGAIRFDIFQGQFTKDSTFIISPFTSGMHYIKDVPLAHANKVLPLLNAGGQVLTQENGNTLETWRLSPPEQWGRTSDSIPKPTSHPHLMHSTDQVPLGDKLRAIPGYITTDDGGSDGDDSIHTPIAFFLVPNTIGSYIPSPSSSLSAAGEPVVDLIYNEYLQPYVLRVLAFLNTTYTVADVQPYLYGETMSEMITRWVKENWEKEC